MEKKKNILVKEIIHTLILFLAALIWGLAFPFQSIGARYLDGWSFLSIRSIMSVIVMLPFVIIIDRRRTNGEKDIKTDLLAGALCGGFLCLASACQQIGIKYTTAAKSGFITALYVIFVPIISLIIFRKKQPLRLWVSVALCLLGLYLLCARGGLKGFSVGDILTLACAVLFAGQILTVSFFVKKVGAVRLTFLQFAVCAIISTAVMVIFSGPSIGQIYKALPALIYVGVMSSAIGYSLQAIGQKGLNPAVASLAMCMESVFSLIGGIFILGQLPSVRETCGCILMFVAIVIAEVGFPLPRKERKNGSGKTD